MPDFNKKRILIIKQSSLGDIIHTLPVVHAIKRCYPESSVGWVVQKAFASLLERDPDVDEVIPIHIPSTSDPHSGRWAYWSAFKGMAGSLRDLRRRFKQRPFDLVLDLHASFRSALLGLMNPGGRRVGFSDAKELNPLFQHEKIRVKSSWIHAQDKNLLFCDYLGCPSMPEDFRFYSDERDHAQVDSFLTKAGWVPGKRLVYVNPAARWATKYWTVENWAALSDRLISEIDAVVVLASSGQDKNYLQQIAGLMKEKAIVAAGSLTLNEAVALLQKSAVYVGLDSGPMHMAAMAGIPVAALFGPTNPELVKPYGTEHRIIVNKELDCLGCRKRSCDDPACLHGISVDQVFDQVLELLTL